MMRDAPRSPFHGRRESQFARIVRSGSVDDSPADDAGPTEGRPVRRPARSKEGARMTSANNHDPIVDESVPMSDELIDELGPVDYLVVEFPAGVSNFTGEIARQLALLVESGTIRLLDLIILTKDESGHIEAFEIDDFEEIDELRTAETEIAEILAEEDVVLVAEAMEPGSTAGVLVWENAWAAPFASAARRAGGQLIASGRIPIQAIAASLQQDADLQEGV
jgi:hypothetical protein